MKRIALLLLVALGTASAAAAQPAPPKPESESLAELATRAREARLKGDVPTWLSFATRTLALTPEHPDILISAARANAAAGNKTQAFDYLAQAARRGAGVDAARLPEFKALAGDPQFEEAAAAARRNLVPIAKAVAFADLPEQSEGIAFDPVSRRLFAGADERGLISIGMDGKTAPFGSREGLRQLLGLKVDAERRLLWVVNGRYPEPGPD